LLTRAARIGSEQAETGRFMPARFGRPCPALALGVRINVGLRELGGDELGAGGFDGPDEPEHFQDADHEVAQVEFPPGEAVAGRVGESVVIVVPSFAEPQYAADEIVLAFIVAVEGLPAPKVANGIDAPGQMMHEKKTHQSAPEETQQGSKPRSGKKGADGSGDGESEQGPHAK